MQDPDWSTDVMSWILPSSYGAASITCETTTAGGAYVGIYLPVPLAPTTTSSTHTETRTTSTVFTSPRISDPVDSDWGMMVGTAVASIAVIAVIGLCAWQAHAGNVKVNVPDAKATCKRMADSVKTSARIAIAPFEKMAEPKAAWEGKPEEPAPPTETEVKHAKEDAKEHFWDWAKDVAQSAESELPRGKSFGLGQAMGSSGPAIPRPLLTKRSEEKEEYFQSFAKELRDIVGSMPHMIDDSPSSATSPPPPPPKRSAAAVAPRPPPNPPPFSRDKRTLAVSLPPPPAVENAERIEVRVDQAFSDWASDFALLPASPLQAKSPPPPPPPPQRHQSGSLPLPPPRPSRPTDTTNSDPHDLNQVSSLRSTAMAPPVC